MGTAAEMKWQEGHCSRGTGVPGMYLRLGGSGGAIVDISRLSFVEDVDTRSFLF